MRDEGQTFASHTAHSKPMQPCLVCGHSGGQHQGSARDARLYGHRRRCGHEGCECRDYQLADVAHREPAEPTTNGSDHAMAGGGDMSPANARAATN